MDAKYPALIVIQGPEPGSVYKLPDNRITTIGRSSQNVVTVITRSVSRFHCEVACVNGRWELTDLNSRRGTMVNHEWVADSVQLDYGDIIRISNVVFRFDMYEEGVDYHGALRGIKEAELDLELAPKGRAEIGMQDIIRRSQMDNQNLVQERRNRRLSARANRMFLTTVGAVVLLGLAGTLLWAHGFIPGLEGVRPPAPPEPANAGANGAETTDNANRAEPPGNEAPPEQPPEEAPQDDYMPHERAWELVEGALLQAGRDRREARYDGAVQALDAVLGREDLPPLPHRRLQQERSLTQAMARAWFEREMARAQSMAEDGRPDDATRTYRQIAAHVGIPELAQQARRAADRTPNTP